jgi:hypothetical protein
MAGKLLGSAIQSNTITVTQLSTTTVTTIVNQTGPRVTSLVYPGNDTAGNTVGGQTVYINGSGFETNNAIYINGNAVPSKSFISASNLSFTTPALSAGIYPVYVINTDSGSTAIFVPGYIASAEPSWVTSAGSLNASQDEASAWSYSLSATGDAPITYALAGGSSLPTGVSLAANGYISGTITSPPGTETTYTFSVVATDAQNQDSTRQFTVTTTSGEGALFANNVLLIHADGTNNQNNHAFLDSSNNNFTITRNGNATQGTFSPFSQTGWSIYSDGTGDGVTAAANSAFAFGTGDFTVEFWAFIPTWTSDAQLIGCHVTTVGYDWLIQQFSTGQFRWLDSSLILQSGSVPTTNQWNHYAVTRSGTTLRIFLNGTQVASGTSNANIGTTRGLGILCDANGATSQVGYASNVRIVKGTALYTSNFTPSTTPLTAVSGTSLLTCQSNRFVDNSSNAFAITRNGDVSIQPFSPFAPTVAYSTANVGGSGYFDGSGDYLTVPAGSAFAPGTSDFTIEAWIYPTNSSEQYIWTQTVSGTNYFLFTITPTTGSLTMTTSGGGTPINGPANSIRPYAWNHVAAVRSGGTVTVYVNGVAGTPGSNAQDLTNTSHVPTIGTYTHNTSASPLTGYLASLRYVKGTAVYTTNFTPPTAPLTNIANTSFLCNYTNAGIFDQTAKTVMETVGETKISTSVYKYGTGSISYDGSGDYILVKPTQDLEFGSGNFTIEFWWYPTSTSRQGLYHGSFGTDWSIGIDYGAAAGKIGIWASSNGTAWNLITADNSQGQGTTTVSQNAWNHIAYVRNGTTWMLFVNGNRDLNLTGISGTIVNRATSQKSIGSWWSTGSMSQASGYMDDFRITKGYARYTSNFTAPTAAFKDK